MRYGRLITAARLELSWVCYVCSYLIPRSEKIWVFIGWHTDAERDVFADNSKYLFLHINNQYANICTVWIAQDDKLAALLREAGYHAHSIHSVRGIYYSLRARYTFIDAFMKLHNWRYSGGSRVVQLWHGKGMKKTGHDSPYSLTRYHRLLFPNLFVRYHALIASSPYTARLMASTFRVPEANVLVTGLPRDDVLFGDIPGAEIDAHQKLAVQVSSARTRGSRKVILYAPTFRPDGSDPIAALELETLNTFLEEHRYHLIISLHPKFARKATESRTERSNISYLPAGLDIYPYLRAVDVLITDYSSLYVDFLLLNRPIIFYTYDLEQYRREMGLHEHFDELTPGPHPKTQDELHIALSEHDAHRQERQHVRDRLFTHQDGDAAARVTRAMLKQ